MMPNKKNVLLIAASIALIGSVFFIVEYRNTTKGEAVYVASADKALNQVTSDVGNKDSDNDGVKDWEEELWGLNPYSKDTGGTGVTDKVKIQKLIAAKQQASVASAQSASTKSPVKETKTDQFSRQFFTNYLEMRKAAGGSLDSTTLDSITTDSAAMVLNDDAPDVYTLKNVKTFSDADTAAVRRYANAFAEIRNRYKNQYARSQISVPESGPDFSDPALIKSFENAAKMYKSMAAELAKLSVPASLAQTHVTLLNAYYKSFRGLWAISATQKDPLASIKGLGLHTQATALENDSLTLLARFFQSKGIFFTTEEAGNFWNSI